MRRAEAKGDEYTKIRIERERLRELAKLPEAQRTKLRKAILHGQDNHDASQTADCSVHAADTMRARLDSLGLLPPRPTKPRPRKTKVDPRQMDLL